MTEKRKILIVKLTSYEGDDTAMTVDPDPLYMVVDAVTGEEMDNGYKSHEHAKEIWEFDQRSEVINDEVDDGEAETNETTKGKDEHSKHSR